MADFIAGYISGAASIILGSPLDIIKVRLQCTSTPTTSPTFTTPISLLRGTASPIVGYGALNSLLFGTYNRTLSLLPSPTSSTAIFSAGCLGGLATFIVSTPTELVKCRSQISGLSSLAIARQLGVRGMFQGGTVTGLRDSLGYGFYFWSYEVARAQGLGVLMAGGLAGCVSWASIYPLDVVKTRVQTWDAEAEGLLGEKRRGAWREAKRAWREEGWRVFWRGLGVCMVRAFLVNAVQWAVYEYIMEAIRQQNADPHDANKEGGVMFF